MTARVGVELEIKNLVPSNELVQLYNKAKLVLYAPYLESVGLVPLESMACGIPVITVREGGVRGSIIHNKTGILTERDENMFGEAVTKLLFKKEKMQKIAQRGIESIHNFWTLEHAGERLLKHLNRVMEMLK